MQHAPASFFSQVSTITCQFSVIIVVFCFALQTGVKFKKVHAKHILFIPPFVYTCTHTHTHTHTHMHTHVHTHTHTHTHIHTTMYTQDGHFPLFVASQEGQYRIVEILLQAGATVDLQSKVENCYYLFIATCTLLKMRCYINTKKRCYLSVHSVTLPLGAQIASPKWC